MKGMSCIAHFHEKNYDSRQRCAHRYERKECKASLSSARRRQAWAISQGTAIIRYASPSGVAFSEWIMYVQSPTG